MGKLFFLCFVSFLCIAVFTIVGSKSLGSNKSLSSTIETKHSVVIRTKRQLDDPNFFKRKQKGIFGMSPPGYSLLKDPTLILESPFYYHLLAFIYAAGYTEEPIGLKLIKEKYNLTGNPLPYMFGSKKSKKHNFY